MLTDGRADEEKEKVGETNCRFWMSIKERTMIVSPGVVKGEFCQGKLE